MKRPSKGVRAKMSGPSQRQLRAGELIRHAMVDILREQMLQDPVLQSSSVTVTEARMSTDLRHAFVFVESLGGQDSEAVVTALNKHTKFLRGQLGHRIVMRFTPDLVFRHDETFEAAERMNRLFDDPKIQGDLIKPEDLGPGGLDFDGEDDAQDKHGA